MNTEPGTPKAVLEVAVIQGDCEHVLRLTVQSTGPMQNSSLLLHYDSKKICVCYLFFIKYSKIADSTN